MTAFFFPNFAKGLLHGVLAAICLWLVNTYVQDKHVLAMSYLLIVFLPLLLVGYHYRRSIQQSLIQQLIIIKEKIFSYPFGVALCLVAFYLLNLSSANPLASYNPFYIIGILILVLFSLTGKLAVIIWFGSVFFSGATRDKHEN